MSPSLLRDRFSARTGIMRRVSEAPMRRVALGLALAVSTLLAACGGGGGSSTPAVPAATTNPGVSLATPPSGPNVVPVSVRQLNTSGTSTANTPYVTVTVCDASNVCQSIPNVLVDTGSAGLRIFANQLSSVNLPGIVAASGGKLAACAQFASGYTWGSMREATVQIGGLSTAGAIPIEVINDPAIPTPPLACQNEGQDFSGQLAGVVNGILGISNFTYDCGQACTVQLSKYAAAGLSTPGVYFSCSGTSCTETSASLDQQGINPVAADPAPYNNGSILLLPAVPLPWGAQTATGVLVLGINSASNNQLPSGAQVFPLDNLGNLSVAVNGSAGTGFIDSGSNGYYLALNLPPCTQSTGFYCPLPPANEALELSSGAIVANAGITIASADAMFQTANAALPALGGTAAVSGQIDLGLPFFFGRPIATGIQDTQFPNGFVAF